MSLTVDSPPRKATSPVQPSGRSLLLDRVTHIYGGLTAVGDVTLDIAGGELVSLLGPSGCGKTTTLRLIGRASCRERVYSNV